jgi:hypothetical protein
MTISTILEEFDKKFGGYEFTFNATGKLRDDINDFIGTSITALLEEIEKEIGPDFKRQDLGNQWNLATGGMETYWAQSEEAVEYYNSCLHDVKEIISKYKK